MRKSGFSLIEVLVVVAIISLLVAIIYPSLKLARWQANELVCRSNLHQVHLSLKVYTSENNGWYPLEPSELNPHRPSETDPERTLLNDIRADKGGVMDAFYCPQAYYTEPMAQNTTDYPPKGESTTIVDTLENRRLGNISYFYWSFEDRSEWRSTNHKKYEEPMDSFRPRWLRESGPPIPFQPSDPETPCALQDYRPGGPGGYWVLSDFFRKGAPFPHHRKHKSGLNVLYLDGHGGWMYGQPRANFK